MALTSYEIINGLKIAVFIMAIIIMYHTLFAIVDLRKVLRRIEDLTSQLEDVLMKPLSVADHLLQWLVDIVEDQHKKLDGGKAKKAKKKSKSK